MQFQKGNWIIHSIHGLGQITGLDTKQLEGKIQQYYVVVMNDHTTLWVPIQRGDEGSLRLPTPKSEFDHLLNILRLPGEQLPDDRYQRQKELTDRMRLGTSESICGVIRDLSSHNRHHKTNDNDTSVLQRAREFLLSEWMFSMDVPLSKAENDLNVLLKESKTITN
jgi:CarD family transcriptional regulator